MRVGPKGRRLQADGSRHSGRLPQNNIFTAIMAPGAQRGMKLAAPSSVTSSIGISELQLYFRRHSAETERFLPWILAASRALLGRKSNTDRLG